MKVASATEGSLFSERMGLPTVMCGPGLIDQGHKPDEFIAASELAKCDAFIGKLLERVSV